MFFFFYSWGYLEVYTTGSEGDMWQAYGAGIVESYPQKLGDTDLISMHMQNTIGILVICVNHLSVTALLRCYILLTYEAAFCSSYTATAYINTKQLHLDTLHYYCLPCNLR